jgi:hypothetical protein
MVITGSILLIDQGSDDEVLKGLIDFTEVTYHVQSPEGTELVVNLEAEDQGALEELCFRLKAEIPHIVEVAHVYVNFEDEIEKIKACEAESETLFKPDFDAQSSRIEK